MYHLQKNHRRPSTYTPKQSTCNNYSDVSKQRKKDIMLFSNSVPKNLKMKDFNAAVTGERVHLKGYLRCKTITSQNVPSETEVKNFFYFVEIFVL